jgi:hypothetical protein
VSIIDWEGADSVPSTRSILVPVKFTHLPSSGETTSGIHSARSFSAI